MSLVNITRIKVKDFYTGQTIYRLLDDDGNFIEAFDRFSKFLLEQSYSFTTRKRYTEVVSRFIDYLFHLDVLGKDTTNFEVNRAISSYPLLLRDGVNVSDINTDRVEILRRYAEATGLNTGLASNSFTPTIAGINCFLRFAKELAAEAAAKMKLYTSEEIPNDCQLLIEAIDGFTAISMYERRRLKQHSVLGALIRLHGEVKRPRGIKSPIRAEEQNDLVRLDFPLCEFSKLIKAATSYRDKALYSLLGASGIRLHEALNLELVHIDVEHGIVYVFDPRNRRFGKQMSDDERYRFKGRTTSRTYLFEPLRSEFFHWMELYIRNEFVPTNDHDFLFQKLSLHEYGKPLKEASGTALNKRFKGTVIRAGIKGPEMLPSHIWTLHSLRHMYGVFMLNYVPVPGGFGLEETEVQSLMGHRSIESTRHYARHDDVLLKAKLEYADRMIVDGGFDIDSFPDLIAKRLLAEANRYRQARALRND